MYLLENDVEWTEELKTAFKHNVTRAKIIYGNNQELNESNNLKELTLKDERYVPSVGFIGQAVAKMLTFKINNPNGTINLENEEITLKIGADYNGQTYYINYGNFIVNEPPKNDDTNGNTDVVAYDYMIKFNQPYVDRITYPCTLLQYLQDICDQAGVELATTDFTNKNFIVENNQFEGKTLREVLQNICKCAFNWARIGQDNKLYLDFVVSDTITETITNEEYKLDSFKKANEYYGPVNQVTYGDSNIQGQEERVKDDASIAQYGLHELVINDNLFAYTTQKRQQLIQGGTRLFGLKYMPISQLDMIGLIYLDCQDILGIVDSEETVFITRNFAHSITYNGIIKDGITTEAQSLNEQAYKNTATTAEQNARTEFKVDRALKQIQGVVSEIGDRSEKTTTVTQDLDGLQSAVDEMAVLTQEVEGRGSITLQNAANVSIDTLEITGEIAIDTLRDDQFPSYGTAPMSDLAPMSNLAPAKPQKRTEALYFGETIYLKGMELINEYTYLGETTVEEIKLPEFVLRTYNDVSDIFRIQDKKAYVIRNIYEDVAGFRSILAEPIIEELGDFDIELHETDDKLYLKCFSNAYLYAKYMIKNKFSENFATKVELHTEISQTSEEIDILARKKANKDTLISEINVSPEQVAIKSDKISLEGIVTANTNFKIDLEGNMECNDAKIKGTIYNENNGILVSQTGLLDLIVVDKSEYQEIGFNITVPYMPAYKYVNLGVYIPVGFQVESATITASVLPINWTYGNTSKIGFPTNINLFYETQSDIETVTPINIELNSEYYDFDYLYLYNNTNALSITGQSNKRVTKTSSDLSSFLSPGKQTFFQLRSSDSDPYQTDPSTFDTGGTESKARAGKTGYIRAVLTVSGYQK